MVDVTKMQVTMMVGGLVGIAPQRRGRINGEGLGASGGRGRGRNGGRYGKKGDCTRSGYDKIGEGKRMWWMWWVVVVALPVAGETTRSSDE